MVLSVVWYKVLPPEFGGQKGIALFTKYLAGKIPLTMLCSENNVSDGSMPFAVVGALPVSKWQFLRPKVWRTILRQQQVTRARSLLIEHCYYGLAGLWVRRKSMIPLIVHSHNIEYRRFRQLGRWWWPLLYLLEQYTHRRADLNLFKTPEDLLTAIEKFGLNPSRCVLVPYGLEQMPMPDAVQKQQAKDEICSRHGINRNHTILLFNGTLDYEPNADGVTSIVHKLMPLLPDNVVVLVCGRLLDPSFVYLKDLQAPGFTMVGYVDDIDTYFRAADVFINPVSTGGGVKVKVMEALSYGLPVVSYASGVAGIDDRYTGNLLRVVPDHDAQAMAAKIMLNEPAVFDASAFIRHYHWEGIADTVAKRIRELDGE